jgi:hypothetical protein
MTCQRKHGGDVKDSNQTQNDRRALEACCQVRDEAVRLLTSINSGLDTYFDRKVTADVDMTSHQAAFFQSIIERMDIAISALEAHCVADSQDVKRTPEAA